jgi:Tol biopolymer transport system component
MDHPTVDGSFEDAYLLSEARDGQARALEKLIQRYAAFILQIAQAINGELPDRLNFLESVFLDALSTPETKHPDLPVWVFLGRLTLQRLAPGTIVSETKAWSGFFDQETAAKNITQLVNTGLFSREELALLLEIDISTLTELMAVQPRETQTVAPVGVAPKETETSPSEISELTDDEIRQLANRILIQRELQRKNLRLRVITLEAIWAILGVVLLIFSFDILGSSSPVQTPIGGTTIPGQITTVIPPVDVTPTRIPFPWEDSQANGRSHSAVLAAEGRFVVFVSEASNLVNGDSNELADIFLYDRNTGEIELVSRGHEGEPANGNSGGPDITPDGRFISFTSWATNLVEGEFPLCQLDPGLRRPCANVYIWERETGAIQIIAQDMERISPGDAGINPRGVAPYEKTTISADGTKIAFYSTNVNFGADPLYGGLFLFDRAAQTMTRIDQTPDGSPVNGVSYWPSFSGDGGRLVFVTLASNLVTDDLNNRADIFLYLVDADQLTHITLGPTGTGSNGNSTFPKLSLDGRWLIFQSEADDLVPNDINHTTDIFLHDLESGLTTLVSLSPLGTSASQASINGSVSANGNFVVFQSLADEYDQQAINHTWDLFSYNHNDGNHMLISRGLETLPADGPSSWPSISSDGSLVVFSSMATNLVPEDLNGLEDIFLYDRQTRRIQRINLPITQ